MKRIRIIHRLRVALALVVFIAILGAVAGLWWANHTGLPNSWRTKIEEALASQGFHAEVASLRYRPLRGIEAGEVVIYTDKSRSRVVARLHELMLDIDRSRLSRGEVKIDRLDLAGARVALAADPADPTSRALDITEAEGRILISGDRHLEIQRTSGMIDGVRIEFDGILRLPRPRPDPTPEEIERSLAERRRIMNLLIDAMDKWGPESRTPPRIRIRAQGDLEDFSSLRASVEIQGSGLKHQSLVVNHLDIRAELRGPSIVVHHAEILTPDGSLSGRLEYDTWQRKGRFEASSRIDLVALARTLDLDLPENIPGYASPPAIKAHGTFARTDTGWDRHLMGEIDLERPTFRHLSADRVGTAFSWDGERLFLEDLEIRDGANGLTGRVFFSDGRIHYEAKTDLPPAFWQNAVTIEPLSTILDNFSGNEDTAVSVDFRGEAVPGDKDDWSFSGKASATHISYAGVPALRATVDLDLNHDQLDFTGGEVDFDYRDYPLRKAHGGPASGHITVDRILYDRGPSTVTVENLRGEAWPGPIVRTFAPELADTLEDYGFHSNPALEADGVIGLKDGLPRQDLTVRFATGMPADYEFLDTVLALDSPRGTVRVLPDRVRISNLSFGLFDGLVRGSMETPTGGESRISGEIDWTRISLPELSEAYSFENQPKGRVTGRLDFDLFGSDVAGLNGNGHIVLEEGELFEVPIFGPLSPVISAVLGRRKAGFQEANEAFCTFGLEDGILSTLDFRTATSSIIITGDAIVNLPKKRMRMTVRMNAQGLFGVITLPLRPLYGMFQFRGTGPIEAPVWKNVMFTKPPEQQEESLLEPPKARPVEPANTRRR